MVTPQGSKLWRLKYRWNGREKLLSIGTYPSLGLRAARTARDRAKADLMAGVDPGAQKRARKEEAARNDRNTFASVAKDVLDRLKREKKAPATLSKAAWLVDIANASIGDRPIQAITARELLDVLKPVEASGRYETARRLRAMMSRVFRHAVATDRAETDPTFALRDALIRPTPTHRAAITNLNELRAL